MMHFFSTLALLGVLKLASIITASDPASLSKRVINDRVSRYLSSVCTPNSFAITTNHTRQTAISLSNLLLEALRTSPFPCEQAASIQSLCFANGTTEIDFLAEQQCICGSSYFELSLACRECYLAHGFRPTDGKTPEQYKDDIKSTSIAECAPTPPFQPFWNLFTTVDLSSVRLSPSMTLGEDKFPNNTAVSNYFTPTGTVSLGSITGSAAARATIRPSGNVSKFTPTSVPPNSGTPTGSVASSGSPGPSTIASANVGAGGEVRMVGGALAMVMGAVALL